MDNITYNILNLLWCLKKTNKIIYTCFRKDIALEYLRISVDIKYIYKCDKQGKTKRFKLILENKLLESKEEFDDEYYDYIRCRILDSYLRTKFKNEMNQSDIISLLLNQNWVYPLIWKVHVCIKTHSKNCTISHEKQRMIILTYFRDIFDIQGNVEDYCNAYKCNDDLFRTVFLTLQILDIHFTKESLYKLLSSNNLSDKTKNCIRSYEFWIK